MSTDTAPQHDCVSRVNGLLAERNTRLATVISWSQDRELIALAVEKADSNVRKKPSMFFASYCPMCGVKLKGMG